MNKNEKNIKNDKINFTFKSLELNYFEGMSRTVFWNAISKKKLKTNNFNKSLNMELFFLLA